MRNSPLKGLMKSPVKTGPTNSNLAADQMRTREYANKNKKDKASGKIENEGAKRSGGNVNHQPTMPSYD